MIVSTLPKHDDREVCSLVCKKSQLLKIASPTSLIFFLCPEKYKATERFWATKKKKKCFQ